MKSFKRTTMAILAPHVAAAFVFLAFAGIAVIADGGRSAASIPTNAKVEMNEHTLPKHVDVDSSGSRRSDRSIAAERKLSILRELLFHESATAQICQRHGVSRETLTAWKHELLDRAEPGIDSSAVVIHGTTLTAR